MALYITSLNSGSNGNCYYIGNQHEAVLIDAGLSCRETEKRMLKLGLSIRKVKAVFISHEHSDHIRGIEVLARKYELPVYITLDTLRNGRLQLNAASVIPFTAYQIVNIGTLGITGFPKFHDAAEPHSFMVSCSNINIGIFTDIGVPCNHVIHHFKQCHAAFLEANYDEQMLMQGNYPYHLKRRISGGNGHLSNKQALDVFVKHKPPFMSHLLLSHLSKENNCPTLVQNLFSHHAGGTQIIVASRYSETPVYTIHHQDQQLPVMPGMQMQYSLFG